MDAVDIPPSFGMSENQEMGMLVFSLCKIKCSLLVNLIFSREFHSGTILSRFSLSTLYLFT